MLKQSEKEMKVKEKPRVTNSIRTFTGLRFYPLEPRVEDIDIDDIAHALSNICRFTGHCRKFYSVAEHCYHVSKLCEPKDALWGLLHDASEAYISDIASPLKKSDTFEEYRLAEHKVMETVAEKFGLGEEPQTVKVADKIMLAIEMKDLMGYDLQEWPAVVKRNNLPDIELPQVRLETWLPNKARDMFLYRFRELTNG